MGCCLRAVIAWIVGGLAATVPPAMIAPELRDETEQLPASESPSPADRGRAGEGTR